jgi:hypothetical protein
MDFGWGARVFWVVALVSVLGAIRFAKRNPPPPDADQGGAP